MRCGWRSTCAKSPTCARNMKSCATEHGFRLLDYSVDADAASPRACFQFSESLPGRRTDFSPFVAVAGIDKPALTADEQQLCVEGLKHGERYNVTLRAGSAVDGQRGAGESPPSSTSMCATASRRCVSPARPMCCRAPASSGIPLVSVNTNSVAVEIFRIGDRNLIDTVLGSDFQRSLRPLRNRAAAASERGSKVWNGETRDRGAAQRRCHHRLSGRSGGRRPRARRLCDDRGGRRATAARRLRRARDAMVHRLRSRADGFFRQ